MHLGGGLEKTQGMRSRSKESYAQTPHVIRLKTSRVFSQGPGAPEGILGLLYSGLALLAPCPCPADVTPGCHQSPGAC